MTFPDEKEMPSGRRLKTSYALHRADTGRLSSGTDPTEADKRGAKVQQIQNIPAALRDIIRAPEGYILVGGDWAAIEWALAIWDAWRLRYADDFHRSLLNQFRAGAFDPHCWLAAHAYDIDYEKALAAHKAGESYGAKERKEAKAYTHGYTFDGSPRGLARNAGHKDEVGIRVCEAHDKAFKMRRWKNTIYDEACEKKYVETPLGWRRYFWDWKPKRQEVINSRIQPMAADLCKWTLLQIFQKMPTGWELLTTTHDSFLLMGPEKEKELGEEFLLEQMQAPVPWLGNESFRADVASGLTWKDV